MQIHLDQNQSLIQFSKHYLIKGWGPAQQEQANNLYIDFPTDWPLFASYLKALGNEINYIKRKENFDLNCILEVGAKPTYNCPNLLIASIASHELDILLHNNSQILRKWSFVSPIFSPSIELVQLSFFHAVTDSIKLGLIDS